MVKEFGVMHEEVSSSFMKQAQQYNALHHKVSTCKEDFERLCRENGERELRIRDRETELAHEDDMVKRLRVEHASLEEKNKRMRDQEEQLEATRKEEHRKYIETLDKCTRQMYASRQASSEAFKAPELARKPGEDSRPGPHTCCSPTLELRKVASQIPPSVTACRTVDVAADRRRTPGSRSAPLTHGNAELFYARTPPASHLSPRGPVLSSTPYRYLASMQVDEVRMLLMSFEDDLGKRALLSNMSKARIMASPAPRAYSCRLRLVTGLRQSHLFRNVGWCTTTPST